MPRAHLYQLAPNTSYMVYAHDHRATRVAPRRYVGRATLNYSGGPKYIVGDLPSQEKVCSSPRR